MKQDSKEEMVAVTREHVKVQQELDDIKDVQARQLKEHEQVLYGEGVRDWLLVTGCW